MHLEQKHTLRSMTPDQNLNIALKLYYSAQQLKAAGLRSQNLDWPEEKIQGKLREVSLYTRT